MANPMPGLNETRWALLSSALIGAVLWGRGSVVLTWIGGGLFVFSALAILWLLYGPTLTWGGIMIHHEGVFEHPEEKYEHGYVLAVLAPFGRAPIDPAVIRVYADAPIHEQVAETEIPERHRREPAIVGRLRSHVLRIVPFGVVWEPGRPLHIKVYSRKPIRTVLITVRRLKPRRRDGR